MSARFFRHFCLVLLYSLFSVSRLVAQGDCGALWVYADGEKYGLKQIGGGVELRAKYDSIICISPGCYLLLKNDRYGLYREKKDRNGISRINGNPSPGELPYRMERVKPVYTKLGGIAEGVEGSFFLANETGYFADFRKKDGFQRSGFIYRELILQPRFSLCRDTAGVWQFKTINDRYARPLDGDSIVLVGSGAACLSDTNKDRRYDQMTFITPAGGLVGNLRYNPEIGKRITVLFSPKGYILIDRRGELISSWSADIKPLANYFLVRSFETGYNNTPLYGVVDTTGKMILPQKFDTVTFDGRYFGTSNTYREGGWLFGSYYHKYELYDTAGIQLRDSDSPIQRLCDGNYLVDGRKYDPILRTWVDDAIIKFSTGDIYEVQQQETYYFLNNRSCARSADFAATVSYYKSYSSIGEVFLGIFKVVTIIPAVFDLASGNDPMGGEWTSETNYGQPFLSGLSKVAEHDGKGKLLYGFIDTSLQVVIPCRYSDASGFHDSIAFVSEGHGYAIIDRSNHLRTAFVFDEYEFFGDQLIIVQQDRRKHEYSVIDHYGRRVAGIPEFDFYMTRGEGQKEITVYGSSWKSYLLDTSGNIMPVSD